MDCCSPQLLERLSQKDCWRPGVCHWPGLTNTGKPSLKTRKQVSAAENIREIPGHISSSKVLRDGM